MSKKKKEEKQKASTRRLIGIKSISDFSLVTYDHGELVYPQEAYACINAEMRGITLWWLHRRIRWHYSERREEDSIRSKMKK